MLENYRSNYIVYKGMDIAIFVNNKALGEIQKIKYNTLEKELKLQTVVLSDTVSSVHEYLSSLKNATILYVMVNENGNKIYRTFKGVTFIGDEATHSIDDPCFNIFYTFNYKTATPYLPFKCTVQELRNQTFNS